jgi:hypothetical protein
LSELDLTRASAKLEAFVQGKNASDMMAKYTVIALWFKEYFNPEEITADHIFTVFRHLGWQSEMPPDPVQPFRNAKSLKNWFDKGSKGAYKINWNGIIAVNKIGAAEAVMPVSRTEGGCGRISDYRNWGHPENIGFFA